MRDLLLVGRTPLLCIHVRRHEPWGIETWPTKPRVLRRETTSDYAKNIVVVVSSLVCRRALHGHNQRVLVGFPLRKDDSPSSLTEHGSGRHRPGQNRFPRIESQSFCIFR